MKTKAISDMKKFGYWTLRKGFISTHQLAEVLAIQARENVETGTHRLLGEILVERGLMTATQVDEVLETMSKAMMYRISVGR